MPHLRKPYVLATANQHLTLPVEVKGHKDKSMVRTALYVLQFAKRHLFG